jgi:ABC-2 type transport system ATP-binding protein
VPLTDSSTSAVRIRGLVVRYGAHTAVNGLDLDAPTGVVTALIGPNGAGKTSTIEVCAGLRTAVAGSVEVLSTTVPGSARDLSDRHGRVGIMLQDGGLYSSASPLEFVTYLAAMYPDPADPRDLLSVLGLDPASRTSIRRLSGGEQQRVKCAAALIGRPELVFLDEPTAGLDPLARRSIHDLVHSLIERGTSVILTTHLMDDVERLASHVVVMAHGRAVKSGTVADLVGDDDSIVFRGPMHADLEELRSALPEQAIIQEIDPGHYRVTGSTDPRALSVIASWSAQHGGRTGDLSIGRRSLEDVIVDLIGEPL